MDDFFQLKAHKTTASKEIICGITTFLTCSYILFLNPAIVSESGMPSTGVFAATALTAAICSIIMGVFANAPFCMAAGMGVNTFFTYVICAGMGFTWQEALAVVFITGVVHSLIMISGLRKTLVSAIPHHLKLAFGAGLGLFIAYVGLKNAGFLSFLTPAGQYEILDNGSVLSSSAVVPSLVKSMGNTQLIAIVGMVVMLFLLSLEKKTGDSYAALPIGILCATFVGIPLNVTDILGVKFVDLYAVVEIKKVFFAFWGDPGLLSILADPKKIVLAGLTILTLLVINIMDSIGTIIGIGQANKATLFEDEALEEFGKKGTKTKLDKALICNSFGGAIAGIMGTTTTTTYMESITGIVSGARTGLASVTAGLMFILCLPLSHFFSIVPAAAIGPALIVAGAFMVPLVYQINWDDFEEAFPAFATVVAIPSTYGFVYGIAAGVLSHVIIQIGVGKGRKVHPILYAIAFIFLLTVWVEKIS